MPEPLPSPPSPGHEWAALRKRLARAARELHFDAFSDDTTHGSQLLAIGAHFAVLALSIPLHAIGKAPGGYHDAPSFSSSGARVAIAPFKAKGSPDESSSFGSLSHGARIRIP